MNKLMEQIRDPDQIRGRESRIRINWEKNIIAYRTPNGMIFKIYTQPTESGGEAVVRNKQAKSLPSGSTAHHYGGGHVCLAHNLRGWDLTRILFQIDSWARGYEIYKKTGSFPDSPKDTFSGELPRPSLKARLLNLF